MHSRSPSAGRAQDAAQIPDWCAWGRGESHLLFVAPHGGRRPPIDAAAPPPHLRVNDVYTPEVTRRLAEALAAGFIVNHGMDRNALDLNRVSQVRRRAPWFLELLVGEIGAIVERHGCAEVVFVHGWNTGQPKCDIGIGAVETRGGLQLPDGAQLTVREAYLDGRIGALRAACAQAQIRATIGARYPASHRNNVLQLFTVASAHIDDARGQRIAAWVADGRLNAVQLELGIPLRWPGVWHERFIATIVEVFRKPTSKPTGAAERTAGQRETQDLTLQTPFSALQFYDPAADVGMFAGVGRVGPRAMAGRLLLFLGGQRVALFTGEEVNAEGAGVVPLKFSGDDEAMCLEFRGPMLRLDDASLYTDLEAALAASHAIEGIVQLEFRPLQRGGAASPQFGTVRGHVVIGGRRCQVHAGGFANAAGLRAVGGHAQTMIAAAFGMERAVLSRMAGTAGGAGLHFAAGAAHPLQAVRIEVSNDGDEYTPGTFELRCTAHEPLHGWALSRMGILRPAGTGGYLRVTFGVARFQWGTEKGYGLYEHARPVCKTVNSDG